MNQPLPTDPEPSRNGVMYVRMSTDHQRYSIENQAAAIRVYAETHNINLIGSYEDTGKSGLTFDKRESLKRLINEVKSGQAPFSIILVLDVTRWGRFQDIDEAAFYEYTCRKEGVEIQYIAEPFQNDGSSISNIVKNIKRVMAAEYSRELSVKVSAGQRKLISLGFKVGGTAGYGYRRITVDQHGNFKRRLASHERKSHPTDRLLYALGPQEEVDNVRWIFNMYVEDRLSINQITDMLNNKGILTDRSKKWTATVVGYLLSGEKYIGNNISCRQSAPLRTPLRSNPREKWLRVVGVIPPIVEKDLFERAQRRRNGLDKLTDEQMLQMLSELYKKEGKLTKQIIKNAKGIPSPEAYIRRFGGLIKLYHRLGFTPDLRGMAFARGSRWLPKNEPS